jgi:hypothetical protein
VKMTQETSKQAHAAGLKRGFKHAELAGLCGRTSWSDVTEQEAKAFIARMNADDKGPPKPKYVRVPHGTIRFISDAQIGLVRNLRDRLDWTDQRLESLVKSKGARSLADVLEGRVSMATGRDIIASLQGTLKRKREAGH